MSGILCHTRFLDGVDYRDAFIDISHNSFTRKGNDSDVYSVNLLRERIPSNPEENLEFGFRSSVNVSNNHLVVTSGNINQSYRAKEVAVTNNTVLGKSNMVIDIDTFALDSSSVTISNCIYRSDGTITDKRSPIGIGSKNINYKIIGKAIESGTVKRTFHNVFGAYYPEVRSKKIIVEYKVKNTLGIYHFHMNFEYGYDPVENRMFVRFTNDSNEAKEFRYSPPSNPSNEPTTDVMPIKLIPLSGSVPPFSIVMRNTQNLGIYTEYRGTGLPQEEVQEIECWIRTIPI
ncbi:hypothetical protein [Caldalkalibacillus mannanilyticus]|uniref:hypothetical protein n=1 Tax=Caldalkalibacillus mannanilyticus TaxID=1418 RepID=UPI00046A28E8|nr:hypothetical protein [Caldalkalibacillus mannanilyticus]